MLSYPGSASDLGSEDLGSDEEKLSSLVAFRKAAYDLLGNGRDALFDLMDANLTTSAINSVVELSLCPLFRRRYHSVYEALRDCQAPREELLKLYCKQLPRQGRLLLAGDHTAWSRPHARTLKDRTFEHQPAAPGAVPITIGQGYSTIVWIPDQGGSWALPLLHERIASDQSPIPKAADQLRRVCSLLPGQVRPLALYDSEYGNAVFVQATAEIPADKLVRLRPNLCLWGPAPPYSGRGRPREHGEKFKLKDPTTWPQPEQDFELHDPQLGPVRVRVWTLLHFRGAKEQALTIILVERLEATGTRREPKALWLMWVGEQEPRWAEAWRLYLRRFAVDHWYRFAKGRLHWTVPQLGGIEQCESWSDLMALMTWQLYLARPVLEDTPLPWQRKQAELTPGRACAGFGALLALIGTPATEPKPRGKSPGWPQGRPRAARQRYAVVKKGAQSRSRAP